MAGHPLRPATRHRLGRPLPPQLADRPRAPPSAPLGFRSWPPSQSRMRYYPAVGPAIPHTRAGRSRVPHPFAGDKAEAPPPDLHVLSTPPAFVLSQDQTLQSSLNCSPLRPSGRPRARAQEPPPGPTSQVVSPRQACTRRLHEIAPLTHNPYSVVNQLRPSPCRRQTYIVLRLGTFVKGSAPRPRRNRRVKYEALPRCPACICAGRRSGQTNSLLASDPRCKGSI